MLLDGGKKGKTVPRGFDSTAAAAELQVVHSKCNLKRIVPPPQSRDYSRRVHYLLLSFVQRGSVELYGRTRAFPSPHRPVPLRWSSPRVRVMKFAFEMAATD